MSVCGAKHDLEYMRQYRARKKSADKANDKSGMIKCSFDNISKFHITISEGPVYICTSIVCAMSVVLDRAIQI